MKKRKVVSKEILQDPKRRGEWAESVFLAKANEHGMAVSKPWGESRSFDVVLGETGKFLSVQVKSTIFACGGGYSCSLKKNNQFYEPGSFDYVAAYVIPEDVWYIVPGAKVIGKGSMILCSEAKQALYEEYREAWHLLREGEEMGADAPAGGEEKAADEAPRPAANAAERMTAAVDFCRRYLQGNYPKKK
ncbi:MAG TPA: group I intron-associated PD-(D/E)XK endonuclease [Verrucomicrobiae bacterium]|jgi:PD-(D/E)XK endonuclease|nr:group I intron-associated PD-(D/E)XK endonuclease [Verrucomicrobiae bacterium]